MKRRIKTDILYNYPIELWIDNEHPGGTYWYSIIKTGSIQIEGGAETEKEAIRIGTRLFDSIIEFERPGEIEYNEWLSSFK